MWNIEQNASTAFHPQTNGQTERVNQEVKTFLTMFAKNDIQNWAEHLALAQFCYNDRKHSATGYSLFYLNYGYHPSKGLKLYTESKAPIAEEFVKEIEMIWAKAKANLEKAANQMKKQHDKTKNPTISYQPGDRVLLSTENINFTHINKKFTPKFTGPFKIIEKVGQSSYQLKIPTSWKIYNVFNEKLLKKYNEPSTSI